MREVGKEQKSEERMKGKVNRRKGREGGRKSMKLEERKERRGKGEYVQKGRLRGRGGGVQTSVKMRGKRKY